MSKEQTALEWYNQQLVDRQNGNGDSRSIDEIFQQAKEMEALQIVEAHGSKLKKSKGTSNYEYWITGIQYYNEKFNNLKCIKNE